MPSQPASVYLCTWKRRKGKIQVSLANDPAVSASGKNFKDADAKLAEELEKDHEGEVLLEYLRPVPKDDVGRRFGDPAIVLVEARDVPGPLKQGPHMFAHDPCPSCKRQRHQRTDVEAEFTTLPSSDGGAGHDCGPLYSEGFIARLNEEERQGLVFRPVHGESEQNQSFLELVGDPVLEFVGLEGFPGRIGGHCQECGLTSFTYIHDWKVLNFIAKQDLPSPLPQVFAVQDDLGGTRLAMTQERYLELRPGPNMDQMFSTPLMVLTDNILRREGA